MSVTCGRLWSRGTTGWLRARPMTITAKIETMNASVGTMNSRADSATPHRLAPVISASTARQSQTRAPYSAG